MRTARELSEYCGASGESGGKTAPGSKALVRARRRTALEEAALLSGETSRLLTAGSPCGRLRDANDSCL